MKTRLNRLSMGLHTLGYGLLSMTNYYLQLSQDVESYSRVE